MTTIVLTADENYLRHIPGILARVARFGRRADGVTLAVPAGTADVHLTPVRAAASRHAISLNVAPVPERGQEQFTRFTPIREGQYASHFTYARLLLAEMLPDLDDVLYLDVDTMIRAPIDELLDWDLRHPLGAVPELAGSAAHLFGTPRAPYFNAGRPASRCEAGREGSRHRCGRPRPLPPGGHQSQIALPPIARVARPAARIQ